MVEYRKYINALRKRDNTVSVLREIRNEIESHRPRYYPFYNHENVYMKLEDILSIINRKIKKIENIEADE